VTLTNAEMLAVLADMTRDLPHRPDLRGSDEIANDMRLEQLAEARRDARREPTSEADGAWLAARWAG
jgi:hypothetical protein